MMSFSSGLLYPDIMSSLASNEVDLGLTLVAEIPQAQRNKLPRRVKGVSS